MTITSPSTPTSGETKPTWATVASGVPCTKKWIGGQEVESGDRILDQNSYRIEWRYRGDVLPTYRLTISSSVYEVMAVGDRTGEGMWEEGLCNLLAST
jgi:head-tail adaptor